MQIIPESLLLSESAKKPIKYLKNFRAIDYDFSGIKLNVIAFGVFDYTNHPQKNERLTTIIDGFIDYKIKHIICLEPCANFLQINNIKMSADFDVEKIHDLPTHSSTIVYDSCCAVSTGQPLSLDKMRYITIAFLLAAQHNYHIGVHCSAGVGRTGFVLIFLRLVELYLKNMALFNFSVHEIYLVCLQSFAVPQRVLLDLSESQVTGLKNFIIILQQLNTKRDFLRWLLTDLPSSSPVKIETALRAFLLADQEQQEEQTSLDFNKAPAVSNTAADAVNHQSYFLPNLLSRFLCCFTRGITIAPLSLVPLSEQEVLTQTTQKKTPKTLSTKRG